MKKHISLGMVTLWLAAAHGQQLYTETFNPNTAIPDGNPVGITSSGNVSDVPAGQTIDSITVGLNLSGGFDGDLYGYLLAPDGTQVVLLNRPGVTDSTPTGNEDSGINVTFQDSAPAITASSDLLDGGTFAAAGTLANFAGDTPDGTWELFLADLSSGGGTSQLNSWTLNITAAPEPGNMALGILVISLTCLSYGRRRR